MKPYRFRLGKAYFFAKIFVPYLTTAYGQPEKILISCGFTRLDLFTSTCFCLSWCVATSVILGANGFWLRSILNPPQRKLISYIHSEAYAAGELKHGTISLIEQGTLVIGVLTQSELYEKTISNMLECKSRGAYLMGLTTYGKYPAHPIGVYFETENIYTLNPSSQYSLDIQALLADWESGNKSRRMILSYRQLNGRHNWALSEEVIRNMKQETAEDIHQSAREDQEKGSSSG